MARARRDFTPDSAGALALAVGVSIQGAVQLVGRKSAGQRLGTGPVIDPDEGIIGHGVADAFGGQRCRTVSHTIPQRHSAFATRPSVRNCYDRA
jgi:hypothetical protein